MLVSPPRSDKSARRPVARGRRRFFSSVFLAMAAQEQGRAWYLFPPTADQIEAEKERTLRFDILMIIINL